MRWWQIKKRDADLERELQSDLELEEEEQRECGLSPEQSRRAALRAFGNPTLIREHTRAVWSWNALENLLRDLRISVRTLFRSPGFSIIAVLVMALCIGAATSLFTVVRSVLLRPLPFRDPDRLVMIYEHFRYPSMNAQQFNYNAVAPADYYDWRAQTHGFEDMAAWHWAQFNLTGERGELPELVSAGGGSWNLFPLLGVHAVIGRSFAESEDRPDGNAVMLTWNLFERRFGGDPSMVGRQIHLDGKPYTVVGVLPKWFTYPDAKMQVWVPYASGLPPVVLQHHDFHFSRVVARLRPAVSLASALSQVEALQYRLHLQNLNAPVAEDVASKTLIQDLAQNVKRPLIILLSTVACMLLIGCLNVANLMVARSAARQKEIAIRSGLGAQRMTLIREQLVESLLVSTAGGVAGVLLSLAATKWLVSRWRDIPSAQSIHVDGVVLAFACGLVVAAALLAGLLPAILSTGKGATAALQASSRTVAGSQSRTALRKTLLTVEIAATVVLLIAAGLLLKSFWRLRTTDVGCTTDNVLTMSYSLPAKKYDSPEKVNAFNETLLERVRALPGVRAVALGSMVPGAGPGENDAFDIPEHPPSAPGASLSDALYRTADPGYFSALQIPLMQGRFFNSGDRIGHPKTMIISQQLAQQYFPGENPLGKHIRIVARGDADYEIVGVVADTLYQVGQPGKAAMYVPVLNGESDPGGFTLAVRTASDPLAYSVPVQKKIAQLDPELPVSDVLTLQQIVERSLGNASLSAALVLAFAVLSLMLASVGLYGVLSYLTTQRTGEIGVRLALGAQREQVVRLILGDGLRTALYGLVLGFAAGAGAVRLIRSMLYETRPLDPAIFAAVAVTLLVVAALACLVPAWSASRIDPMQALRGE
ncbi:MAG TPA: ABC transporter permease [Acidobacteriaceae bacterium]|jgi:putative ABC transport system permease protein|nr:ABC transporter permease [Acidobacteriaceae bacterium]